MMLGEAHDALVELDPLVHLAELDVADDVVDAQQADARAAAPFSTVADVAGQVRAAYSARLTNVWTFSPYVAIAASSTRPYSSSTQCGSTTPRAPRWTACR